MFGACLSKLSERLYKTLGTSLICISVSLSTLKSFGKKKFEFIGRYSSGGGGGWRGKSKRARRWSLFIWTPWENSFRQLPFLFFLLVLQRSFSTNLFSSYSFNFCDVIMLASNSIYELVIHRTIWHNDLVDIKHLGF